MRTAQVIVERPTILIGIGGTGCRIAERVLARAAAAGLPPDSRALVVGIDTHVRDLRELRHIERRFRIQISDQRSVRELLMGANWEEVKSWHLPAAAFSEDTLSKSLLSGAGQIRMLSRLATHLAMRDGSIEQVLREAITRVTGLKNDNRHAGEVQIVVTASLAGATGSGSFIQIASIMDQLCRASGVTGLVRGVFLLGDVFVRTSTLPAEQTVNAQFNTYASLAELNACNAYASGRGVPLGFDFEVAPGYGLKSGVPPLQTVTLIDFENDIGGNLGNDADAYFDMAARAAYQYAFTPIGERLDGVMINDVRARQRAEDLGRRPLYSGIGVHTILYPRDAIEDHVVLAYASETLRGEWLILDDLFDIAYRDWEMRRQTDPGAPRPDVGDLFLRNFELLRGDSAFIKQIHADLHPGAVDLDGNLPPPVHSLYREALSQEVLRQYWELPPLPLTIGDLVPHTVAELTDDDDLPRTVQEIETQLDRAWQSVQTTTAGLPTDIFRTVFSAGLEPERLGGYRDHHLKKWLVLDRRHLVGVRWFLYALARDVRAARDRLDPREIQTAIEGLGRQFDPPRRRSGVGVGRDEAPKRTRSNPEIHARAEEVRGKGFLGLGAGRRRTFVARLVAYEQNSIALIRKWAVARVEEQVFDGLLREIEALISLVEMSFDRVKLLRRDLEVEIADTAGTQSSARGKGVFDGIRYVYAEPQDKRAIARAAIESNVRTDTDGAEVNGSIGELIFATYIAARKERPANPSEAIVKTDVAALGAALRTRLVEQDARRIVRSRLRAHYDFSVWQAVQLDWRARRAEAERGETPPGTARPAATAEAHLERLVEEVRSHAQPFIDYSTVGVGQSIIYWSIHPAVVEEFGDRARLIDILKSEAGENPDENEVYGTDELLCTHVRANLDLSDIKKLHPGEASDHARGAATGVYRAAYLKEVAPLRAPTAALGRTSRITPHIDRNWHKAGVLPELFADTQRQIDGEIDRSIVIAFVLDLLIREVQVGRGPITSIDLSKLPGGAGAIVEIAASTDDWAVIKQLRRNSDTILAAAMLWDTALATMDVANARLLKSDELVGLAERILALAVPNDGEEEHRRKVAESLLARLFEVLIEVVQRLMPEQTAPARAAYARQIAGPAGRAAIERLAKRHTLAPEQVRSLGLIVERVHSAGAAAA